MEATKEREAKLDEMVDKAHDIYQKFRNDIGMLAVEYGENPFALLLAILEGSLQLEKERMENGASVAAKSVGKLLQMAEKLGVEPNLLMTVAMHNDDFTKELLMSVMNDEE